MIHCQHNTAVVVLSYNGKDLHQQFFPLLLEQAVHYDVVLIDNASTDDTALYVATHFPQVKIIKLPINKGFANGYYEGLKQIDAKYYVLLSADFEITENWFAPLHQLLETHQDIAACQPKIKYYKDKKMFEYAGAGGGFIDKWGYLFCRGRIFFTLEEDQNQYDDTIETFWAGGGCMFIRSSVYHNLGGLDKDLYAHMEEVDLCWRMKNAGHRIAYCGASTVYHIGGSVISYGSPQKIFYNYRNNLILILKNVPWQTLLWLFPLRLLLDGISGLRALLKGQFQETIAIIKAHWSLFIRIGFWYKKRKASLQHVNSYTKTCIYPRAMIVDYFFKKKHFFTDLDFPTKKV
ncbi:MAG: glycosyltransferase family 2 protein [Chitinophagaceae bacterium]